MKKLAILASSLLLALSLLSCGKKIDSSVWLSNLEDGKKAAQAENKRIFLFFSGDDFDEKSASLKSNLFNTEEFISTYTEKYVLVNLDYSNSRYDGEQEGLTEDMKIFERYNAKGLPYFLVLSSEGYLISQLAFDSSADLDTARITFTEAEEKITRFEETLAKTKTGSTEERLAAINEIFDNAEPAVAALLSDLNKLYLSLDKNNASGESSKHLIALTYATAQEFFMEEQPEKASNEFVKLAKNKILTDSEKQMSYYTAGYLLIQSGSNDYKTVQEYLKLAYDANPESEEAQNIQMAINYVQTLLDGEGDDLPENAQN